MTQIAKDKIYGKLLHKRSIVQGNPPTGTTLDFGEIAVNFNELEPFLSIRTSGVTSDKEYVKFPSQKELDKLENSINLQLDEIESNVSGISVTISENEEIVAAAINALNDRIDGIEEIGGSLILTMDMIENRTEEFNDYNGKISGSVNEEFLTSLLKAKTVVFVDEAMYENTTSITFIRNFEQTDGDVYVIQFLGVFGVDDNQDASYVLNVHSNGSVEFINNTKINNPKLGLSTVHDVEFSDLEKEQFKANLGINNSVTPDWDAKEWEEGHIENRTHYYMSYVSEETLYADDSTIGTNICSLYTYFKLGGYTYNASDMLNKEFNY